MFEKDVSRFFVTGCFLAAAGVGAGAFGAHSLKNAVTPEVQGLFETAVRYQMYHAFALLATAWALASMRLGSSSLIVIAGWCFISGIVMFSGSLYVMGLFGATWIGPITPIGGLSFIAGWILLALGLLRGRASL